MKQKQYIQIYTDDIKALHPTTLKLYTILLSYAQNKDTCYPGLNRLATDLNRCKRTIQRNLSILKKLNYISIKNRGNKSNLYTMLKKVIIDKKEKSKETAENISKKSMAYAKQSKKLSTRNFKERKYDLDDLERQLTAHQLE